MLLQACETNAQQKSLTKTHCYGTQNKKDLNHPLLKNKWYQDSFMVQCTTDFNALPREIKEIKKYEIFVKRCKTHLLHSS